MTQLPSDTSLFDQLSQVRKCWVDKEQFRPGTLQKYDRVHVDWLQHAGAKNLGELSPTDVANLAARPTRPGRPPSTATQALRLAVFDTTFATAHALGITDNDPVARVTRPQRHSKGTAVPAAAPTELSPVRLNER